MFVFLDFHKDPSGYSTQKNELWEDFKANNKEEYKRMKQRLDAMEVAPVRSLPKVDQERKVLNAYKQITHQVNMEF